MATSVYFFIRNFFEGTKPSDNKRYMIIEKLLHAFSELQSICFRVPCMVLFGIEVVMCAQRHGFIKVSVPCT